jgi:hypothetical protein
MADRIQARAIRRCGQLLREIAPSAGGRPPDETPETREGALPSSRKSAADAAGLSEHRRKTALRVANVPEDEFEEAVEADDPATVTELAERGKKPFIFDLRGRDPNDFKISTQAQGELRRFSELANEIESNTLAATEV